MTKDIRASIRQFATNDSARAILATAAGELIKKVAKPGKTPEQPDGRVVASGIGGFAAGAGAATLVTATAKRLGKAAGRRRRPLFADVPKKAAAGTRKAVEVPKEAVDRVASGLRDQVGGGSSPSKTSRSRKPSASKPKSSGTRTRAKSTRSSNGSSAESTRSSSAKSTRGSSAKSTRSSNGSSARKSSSGATRTRPKSTRSSNGSSGRSRATASARR